MHQIIEYSSLSRHERDALALQDMHAWLTQPMWDELVRFAGEVKFGKDFDFLYNLIGLVGVSGAPVGAFGRTFCLLAYREWMHTGEPPVLTDEDGFVIHFGQMVH